MRRVVTPVETIRRCYARIEALSDPGIFISLREEHEAIAEAKVLNEKGELYGVPVAVKDNIDDNARCQRGSGRPTRGSALQSGLD
jgi:allophanate hydrolase